MLEKMPAAVGRALASIRPGLEKTVYASDDLAAVPDTISLSSDAFADGAAISTRHTGDGARVSPPLRFRGIPQGARSLVLIVEDADSPTPSPLCHALAWNIEPLDGGGFHEAALDADAPPTSRVGAAFGKNSMLSAGWLPPDPPPGHGAHRYAFQVYALDKTLAQAEGTGRSALVAALKGHVLAKGLLVGTYERPG